MITNNDRPFSDFGPGLENDWIILKLDSNLTLNPDVQPACLPPDPCYLPLSETREQCWTSGWGTLSSGTSITQFYQLPITNTDLNFF